MIILIRKRHVAYVVLLCCFVAGLSAVLWHGNAAFTAAFAPGEEGASPVVVVDAGHGGEDGGAVAADGTVESGLNLAIARRVRDLLTFAGVPTTVTREGDAAIYDPGSATLREKKVSDLHNRVALVNELPGAVLLSIHQNSLPSSPSTRGAQVFWNRQEGAEPIFCDREAVEALGVEIISRPVATVENGLVRHNPGHLAWELVQLHNQRNIRLVCRDSHRTTCNHVET